MYTTYANGWCPWSVRLVLRNSSYLEEFSKGLSQMEGTFHAQNSEAQKRVEPIRLFKHPLLLPSSVEISHRSRPTFA